MKILITGSAGFIGFHLARKLISEGWQVIGIDNLNDYYDPKLKEDRLAILQKHKDFVFKKVDLKDKTAVDAVFVDYKPEYVINLAAQAGVRYSIQNPYAYIDSTVQTPNFGHYAAITSGFKSFLMIALWYSLGGLSLRLP